MIRPRGALLAAAVVIAGCGTSGVGIEDAEPPVTLFADDEAAAEAVGDDVEITTSEPPAATVVRAPVPAPRGDALGIVFRAGVALPVTAVDESGWTATRPCGEPLVAASPTPQTFVVMADPGGDAGIDPDSVAVAELVAEALAAELDGVEVTSALTRRTSADVAIADRLAAVDASGARVLVSVVVGDDPSDGFEVVHRAADTESHRLAGLVLVAALAELAEVDLDLGGDPAVTAVINQRGSDYYAALRSDDLVAVVVRLPASAAQLDVVDAIAARLGRAMAAGVYDFLTTDSAPQFGAPTETVRTAPIASGTAECVDPTEPD